jgi:hypothetical protein
MARSLEVMNFGPSAYRKDICQHSRAEARANRMEGSRVRRVVRHKFIDVSGEHIDSIFRVEQ